MSIDTNIEIRRNTVSGATTPRRNTVSAELSEALDAYQLALREGFAGSREEWLASLVGQPGQPGQDGQPGTDATVTLAAIQAQMETATTNTSVLDDDVMWIAPAAKTPGRWVPWLTGIVAKLKSVFVNREGGQTIQSSAANVVTLTLKGAASQTENIQNWVNSSGAIVASVTSGGALVSGTYYVNGQRALESSTTTLTLGGATYWTTINYGTASTTAHVFNGQMNVAVARNQFSRVRSTETAHSVSAGIEIGNTISGTSFRSIGQFGVLDAASGNTNYEVYFRNVYDGTLRFQTNGQNDRLRITSSAATFYTNVGIGTTSPGAALHVLSPNQTTKGLLVQGAAGQLSNLIEAQNSGGTAMFYVSASGTIWSNAGFSMSGASEILSATPTLTLRSTSSNAANAGTIAFGTPGDAESCKLTFDAADNMFLFKYGTSTVLSYTALGASVTGTLVVTGNFTGSGTDSRLPNQIPVALSSIVTRKTAAGLSGYHMHRQCAVNGSWYAGYNQLGGGFSASGPQLQVYNSTTLGSRSFPSTLQFDLAPLGSVSGNGYSSIDWNMSEIWMEFVFKLSWAINSSNVRKNQVLRMGFGNLTADCIGGSHGCVGFHVASGASETNYDIRVFNAIGETAGKAPISAATFASPIVVTQNYHGFATGDLIEVDGCVGNTAANGIWTVTRLSAHTYSLDGSTGNGTWTSGGASHRITDVLLNTTALNNKKASLLIHKTGGVWNFYMNGNLLVSIPHVSPTVMGFGIMGMLAKTMVGGTGTTNMYVYEVNYGCEP